MEREIIEKRIAELDSRLQKLLTTPKRGQQFHHSETIAEVCGEITGLKWALMHTQISEPNLIEQ